MVLPVHTVPAGDVASEDEQNPLLSIKLVNQEVAGTAKMSVRLRPLWQEHATTTIAIHHLGIQASEDSVGSGAEGIL